MKLSNIEDKETYGAIFPDKPTTLRMRTQNKELDVMTLKLDGTLEISDELAEAIAGKLDVGYRNIPNKTDPAWMDQELFITTKKKDTELTLDYKKVVEDMREWLYEKIKVTSKEVLENSDISGETMNTYVYIKTKLDELINSQ